MRLLSRSITILLFGSLLGGAQSSEEGVGRPTYPRQWPPGPRESSVPDWARPGKIRFARWDGGPLETAKAMLSGWPGFNPPVPDFLYTMTNWYDPSTVQLLRDAGFNLIWITFSNGFSNQTESFQRELAGRYIDECHRSGIHVLAYQSIANMFWEDMYGRVPESRQWAAKGPGGNPVPYRAALYQAAGRITRYMADIANPGWRAYLRKRIDLALDAGADGIMYDNNPPGRDLLDLYRDLYGYGARRKSDFLLMGNFSDATYAFNRLINAMTNESAVEPGVYGAGGRERPGTAFLALRGGRLMNNIGLLRVQAELSGGWKPAMVEDRVREADGDDVTRRRMRLQGPMRPPRVQLALAEAMMFSIASEIIVEGGFANGLRAREPEAMAVWRAIGRYNRFFADHEAHYTGVRSLARLAVVLDDRSAGIELLNGLAARNVIFDVVYEHDLTAARLAGYAAAAVLTAETVRAPALAALEQFVARGGKLFAAGRAARVDEGGQARPRPPLFARKGVVYWEQLPPVDELARVLRTASAPEPVTVQAAPGILYNAVAQPQAGRVLVHSSITRCSRAAPSGSACGTDSGKCACCRRTAGAGPRGGSRRAKSRWTRPPCTLCWCWITGSERGSPCLRWEDNSLMSFYRVMAAAICLTAAAWCQTRIVRATGDATLSVKPDLVKVSIGVVTTGKTAQEAATQNASQMDAVLAKLKQALGAAGDTRTVAYSITPLYTYTQGQPAVLTGFSASNTVEASTSDLASIGSVIDAASQAGANSIQGLVFTLKDSEPVRAQALSAAARQARAHAEAIATGLGARLGAVRSAQEGTAVTPVTAAPTAAASPTPIESGLVQVSATVTADFELLQ